MSALQYCELLAKGEVFQKQPTMSVEEAPDRSRQEPNGVYHVPVLSHSACGWQRRMLLKSQADRILARHKHVETVFGYAETGYCGTATATILQGYKVANDAIYNLSCWRGWLDF